MFPNFVVQLLLNFTSDSIHQHQSSPNTTIGYPHQSAPNITIINRKEWGADNMLSHPVPYVIIHHTGYSSPGCTTKTECIERIRKLQAWNMALRQETMYDIAYNFVVAGDGNVYEGTGWFIEGSHTRKYYHNSIGIAFLGDWTKASPPKHQLEAAKRLIKVGVAEGYISKNYKLKGHKSKVWRIREHDDEDKYCPGLALNMNLKTWKHYDGTV